jgi:hypothetical protein
MSIAANVLGIDCPSTTIINSTVSFPNSLVSFDDNLPKSTLTTATLGTQFITRAIADGRFGQLAAANTWSNVNTFSNQITLTGNILANSLTITPTELGYLDGLVSNIQTQLIGKGNLTGANTWTAINTFSNQITLTGNILANSLTITPTELGYLDGVTSNIQTQLNARASLNGVNTWTEQNTFRKGILPCTALTTTNIQLGGNNQLQYRQATSLNNISIGNNTLRGDSNALGLANNTGSRNIGIGGEVLVNLDTGNDNIFIGYQAGNGVGLSRINSGFQPSRCIAIGTYAQSATNLYATDAIAIGYNSLRNASGPAVGNICIGSNTGNGILYDQYAIIIGSDACPSASGTNSIVCIGYEALKTAVYVNSTVCIGWQSGYKLNAAGSTFVGSQSGYAYIAGNYNTCLGMNAGYSSTSSLSYTICLGYNSFAVNEGECVLGGNTLQDQILLTLPNKHRLSCNILATTATYNLPFRGNENVIINSTVTTINLPTPNASGMNAGAKFNLLKTTSASNITINAPSGQTIGFVNTAGTYTTASTYTFTASTNNISVLCIASTGTTWLVINNNAFTDLISNQSIAGIKTFTGDISLKKYYLSMVNPTTITTAGTTMGTPLYEYNKVNFAGGTINLPLTANVEIGTVLRFRKIGNLASGIQVTPNTGQSIYPRNSVTTQTSATDIMGGGAAYGSVIYIDTNTWAITD